MWAIVTAGMVGLGIVGRKLVVSPFESLLKLSEELDPERPMAPSNFPQKRVYTAIPKVEPTVESILRLSEAVSKSTSGASSAATVNPEVPVR